MRIFSMVGPGDVARSLFYNGLRKGAGPKVPLTLKGYFARGPHLPGFDFTLAYGQDFPEFFRRAAAYVDKILKGADPADLPVEQPTKFKLALNFKTAKAFGLTFPQTLITSAGEVVE